MSWKSRFGILLLMLTLSLCLSPFVALAAPPPPPRWDHIAKKEGTRQKTIEGAQPFKERSRLTRAR